MEVETRGTTAASDSRDPISLPHMLSGTHKIAMIMGVNGHQPGGVPQNHDASIPSRSPRAEKHLSVGGSTNGRPLLSGNVKAIVSSGTTPPKTACDRPLQWPEQARRAPQPGAVLGYRWRARGRNRLGRKKRRTSLRKRPLRACIEAERCMTFPRSSRRIC